MVLKLFTKNLYISYITINILTRVVYKQWFLKRLAMWQRQYSKGGRLTLLRSTLSNLPIYFMSLLSIPRKVKLRLKKIQRDLCRGRALEKKPHLVKWSIVCIEKRKEAWVLDVSLRLRGPSL